ncbi:TonB-dependent siderophore receptor [Vibrio sp. RE88]|uniref:TonB-dependent siderophore receptor n=1 Tax=Vibrio sp. RE88 TaxID=2607610 RepID=UPI001493AC28|nr:TonB-dependent siderophore receptor [Vibrio sp. RE88]NOH60409.1 TonB-dependent siderophore receptor [Vibrio sp. RE88]
MTTPTNFKRSTLTLALLTAFSASVMAADEVSQDTTELETITVMGKAYRNTATKTSLEPEETPQSISIIEGEQLEQRGVKSLNQALRYAPGVVTEQKGAAVTMYDTFSIRGFKVNQSYYDGLVLQSLAGWNLQPQIDPVALQQIEVFKGPTSVLYGTMPPGGMINMIAKAPQQEKATEVSFATGSRNLVEASIDTTGQIGDGPLSYRIIALARTQDGQVDNTKEERYVFAPSLDWQVSDRTLINFNMYYQNDPEMGMNSSLPSSGMFVSNPNGSTSPSTFIGDTDWNTFEREVLMLGYKVNHEFESGWTFLQNARFTDASLYQENTYMPSGGFDPSTGNIAQLAYSTDEESTGFTIDNQLSGTIALAGAEHNILLGVDYQNLDGTSDQVYFSTPFMTNIINPNSNLIDRDNMGASSTARDEVEVKQLGFYLQDQVRLDKLVLIAGGRYDLYEGEWYGSKADQNHFSYRVGALYELPYGFSPYVNYATSFEPVTGGNDGKQFVPEEGKQIEGGIKYESEDYSKAATLGLFQIVKENMLVADPSDPTYQRKIQVGEVTSKGVELEGRWAVNEALDVNASYTYTDMTISKDVQFEGKTPIYVPDHTANLWANYYFYNGALNGLRVSGGGRYVGEMQIDAQNTGKVPSYTIADLSLSYDLGRVSESLTGANANLIVNNLFNEEYYTCYDSNNCWYGAEQTIEVNVKYEF